MVFGGLLRSGSSATGDRSVRSNRSFKQTVGLYKPRSLIAPPRRIQASADPPATVVAETKGSLDDVERNRSMDVKEPAVQEARVVATVEARSREERREQASQSTGISDSERRLRQAEARLAEARKKVESIQQKTSKTTKEGPVRKTPAMKKKSVAQEVPVVEKPAKKVLNKDEIDAIVKRMGRMTPEQSALVTMLCKNGQSHLFEHVAATGTVTRQKFLQQLQELDRDYEDGGLEGYIRNAKALIQQRRDGENPWKGYKAVKPLGEKLELGSKAFAKAESVGLQEIGRCGFVLLAGGLGERLGYSSTKLALPTDSVSEKPLLQLYIENILNIQRQYAEGRTLPLCIMTSAQTTASVVELLRENKFFGMSKGQITVVQQGKGVPVVSDNDASFVMEENDFKLAVKPHGHGDIHSLMYQEGISANWFMNGIKWIYFFQDNNPLAFNTLPLMVGVSARKGYVMNSLAVPRIAKQANGAIVTLKKPDTNEAVTTTLEYSHLDEVLRDSGFKTGDFNDKKSGISPFPGNTNQILVKLDSYHYALGRKKGVVREFINQKYTDADRNTFHPVRLEGMLQAFAESFTGEEAHHVGYTCVDADVCFSPIKNSAEYGRKLQSKGGHPATLSTADADVNAACASILRSIGCVVEQSQRQVFNGIAVEPGPRFSFQPDFVCCATDYHKRFPQPHNVRISSRSTLVIRGDVTIESLDLDGCLYIDVEEGESYTVTDDVVKNEGWVLEPMEKSDKEITAMRGYILKKKDTRKIEIMNTSRLSVLNEDEENDGFSFINLLGHAFNCGLTGDDEVLDGAHNLIRFDLRNLTRKQQDLVKSLCAQGQSHLFDRWPEASEYDRVRFMSQLEFYDSKYPLGGLEGYVQNARKLLRNKRTKANLWKGWKVTPPRGALFDYGTRKFNETEAQGMKELSSIGFVLLAGGLGERLGYKGTKLEIPVEMTTETTYLQLYIEYILAMQTKHAPDGVLLPLCIMTSPTTTARTIELLRENNFFGMERRQITVVQQSYGVPALSNADAAIALEKNDYQMIVKPHGHGDIHALMHREGIAKKWQEKGIKWVYFFNDDNGLAFNALPLMLGVSASRRFAMNSLAVPRRAKQPGGAITRLTDPKSGRSKTIIVDHEALNTILLENGSKSGEVNDFHTCLSPYPASLNQILVRLDAYTDAIASPDTSLPEYFNPKFADRKKEAFQTPARLECMVQDLSMLFSGDAAEHVGFTCLDSEYTFSPVKNAIETGVVLQLKGSHPATLISAEADQYAVSRRMLQSIGVQIEDSIEETFNGISAVMGPAVVLKPDFATCRTELLTRFPDPTAVRISKRSTLIVRGNVTIESLDLDGTLVIDVDEGWTYTVRNHVVKNAGWVRVRSTKNGDEISDMRGSVIKRKETKWIELSDQAGTFSSLMKSWGLSS